MVSNETSLSAAWRADSSVICYRGVSIVVHWRTESAVCVNDFLKELGEKAPANGSIQANIRANTFILLPSTTV